MRDCTILYGASHKTCFDISLQVFIYTELMFLFALGIVRLGTGEESIALSHTNCASSQKNAAVVILKLPQLFCILWDII